MAGRRVPSPAASRETPAQGGLWIPADPGGSPGDPERAEGSGDRLAGVDEAGRGSLAGPVVAGAVILPPGAVLSGLTDSKLLPPEARARLAAEIQAVAIGYAVAAVEAAEIDATNILQATLRAMANAIRALPVGPRLVLVDGNVLPPLPVPARAVVHGDRLVPAISAASILAKVARDAIMDEWGRRFPSYGFGRHKGYGTADHLASIGRYGPCPIHRKSFKGVREHVGGAGAQGSLW